MALRFSPSRGAGAFSLSSYLRGPTGAAATITAGTTTTLAEGSTATVSNSGTSSAATFNFGVPRGAVPAIGFNFSTTTTDSDPGAGNIRFNNATPASVTLIYFDNVDRDGNTVTTWLDFFDDSTSTSKGSLIVTPAATPSAKLIFAVSGTVVDGTGYRKVTVTQQSGTTLPTNGAHLAFEFIPKGDVGAIGGTTGATDNAILRADGTGGTVVQSSSVQIDDTANIVPATNDVGGLGTTSLKWADIFLASGAVINFNSGDVLVTHSANALAFTGASGGYSFDAAILPTVNDGFALGSASLQFSDLFLAEGAVINFDNGDMTMTQVGNVLTITGGIVAMDASSTVNGSLIITLASGGALTAGFTSASVSAGTKSSGTYTFDPTAGAVQHATNGGAHTFAPPATHGSWMLDYVNNGSAGALTTSGWTKVDGDPFDTTNTHAFRCYLSNGNSGSHLTVKRLV